ncbi:FAD-dependent oxidoreductase [Streptomyces lavendulae]|uniref:FAD-dependent oxidoreductase n=1 Tax=Streptomyces lavendulae TaxID=1914 RepID=UPI0036C270F2
MHDIDCVILGAGCAGLFMAEALSSKGATCLVIDDAPAAHASTKNQGWLQTGAFYASINKPLAAQECWAGYNELTDRFPEAIHKQVRAYALFTTKTSLNKLIERCTLTGIPIDDISDADTADIQNDCPLLKGTTFEYIAALHDHPFNSAALLTELASELDGNLVSFWSSSSPIPPVCRFTHSGWEVSLPGKEQIHAVSLVLACGAYSGHAIGRILPELQTRPLINKAVILTLSCSGPPISSCILTAPLTVYPAGRYPAIVPFFNKEGTSIIGANVYLEEKLASHARNSALPRPVSDYANQLQGFFPGLVNFVGMEDREVKAHFYVCHALQDSYRIEWHVPERNLTVFSPGRFTASPVAAQKCAETILRDVSSRAPRHAKMPTPSDELEIPVQPYFDTPSYRLDVLNDFLIFDELAGS